MADGALHHGNEYVDRSREGILQNRSHRLARQGPPLSGAGHEDDPNGGSIAFSNIFPRAYEETQFDPGLGEDRQRLPFDRLSRSRGKFVQEEPVVGPEERDPRSSLQRCCLLETCVGLEDKERRKAEPDQTSAYVALRDSRAD